MPTLKDVAAKAGVSLSTAGAAMRGEDIVKPATKERVLAAAKELGYSPNLSARFLKKGRTGAIAVMVPNIMHPYYTNLVYAVCQEADKHGLRTIIQQTGYTSASETDVLEQMASSTLCDGLILNASNVDDRHLRTLLGNHPAVLLNYMVDEPLFDNVQPAITRGVDLAFGYLQGRGYRHVAVIGARAFDPDDPDISRQNDGIQYAMNALIDSGMGYPDDFVDCNWSVGGGKDAAEELCRPIAQDNATHDDVAHDDVAHDGNVAYVAYDDNVHSDADGGTDARSGATDRVRRVDRYDAFYCMNDLIAYGLIRGLHEHGIRVPDDKAVFGHDGVIDDPFTIPSLSTVAVDYADMAHKAVDMLLEQINHPDGARKPRTTYAGCRLVIGESA
ncbi:LacI family DNA-binding transcriptional regulator [Bifidobacterium biavatii]|uniref:Regulatory protein LacI n=1 Tax=Bifidobacterium biavatii DSM 23969 TaxID=1437608 RepID=A0A086ZMX4_9BIFI|nr:LacI family DNA-binding transcriptional regulator [Bifidobacterium biavatii]KFI47874.1 regulatory protein LacI [Bifidobacterium biavatii DSM 23969]